MHPRDLDRLSAWFLFFGVLGFLLLAIGLRCLR